MNTVLSAIAWRRSPRQTKPLPGVGVQPCLNNKASAKRIYNVIFAIAIVSTAYIFALSHGNVSFLTAAQGAVILLPCMMFQNGDLRKLGSANNLLIFLILAVLLISNLVFHVGTGNYLDSVATPEFAALHALGILGMIFSLQWAAANLFPAEILRYSALFLLPLIVIAIVDSLSGAKVGGRAVPFDVHPNWWGELAFAFTLAALALRGKTRMLSIGTGIVLFVLVQSRGALVAALVCIGSYTLFRITVKPMHLLKLVAIAGLPILGILSILFFESQAQQLWQFVRDDIFLWNNPYRGTDSRLTGRLDQWLEAIDVIANNPILGGGFDTLKYVHNGFLQIAGEGGLPLCFALIWLMVSAVWTSYKTQNYLRLSGILGYWIYAMTYPRMLNMNVASMFFYLCLLSWRDRSGAGNRMAYNNQCIFGRTRTSAADGSGQQISLGNRTEI